MKLRLSIRGCVFSSVCPSVKPSVCLLNLPSVHSSVHLSVLPVNLEQQIWLFLDATMHHCKRSCPSVRRLVGPSVHWSGCWSIHLSICLSVRRSVHPTKHDIFYVLITTYIISTWSIDCIRFPSRETAQEFVFRCDYASL